MADFKTLLQSKKLVELSRTARDSARQLSQNPQARQLVRKGAGAARAVASSLPYRELAKMCGRAGAAGAIVDGSMGGLQAFKAVREGKMNNEQAAKHVAAETGCGFVTSAAGTAGTLAAYMVTGTMGPVVLAAGMGASMGSRYIYRQVVGETMPGDEGHGHSPDNDHFENIGPKPQDD